MNRPSKSQICMMRLLSFYLLFLQEMAQGLMIRHSVAQGICLQSYLFAKSKTMAGQIREPLKKPPYPLNLKRPKCAWLKLDEVSDSESALPTVQEMTCDELGLSFSDASQGRIVNGSVIVPDSFPSFVRLQAAYLPESPDSFSSICGATIIDKNWAITAKHCGKDEDGEFKLRILSGRQNEDDEEEGEQARVIDRRIEHPDNVTGDPVGKKIDLLLLHWEEPLAFGKKAQPAPLFTEAKESGQLTLVGTGLTDGCSPCEIKEAAISVITDELCNNLTDFDVERWVICVKGPPKTGCFGDSGGPMYFIEEKTGTQALAGIISFIYSESDLEIPCFQPDIFTAAMEVYWFQDWIQENIKA